MLSNDVLKATAERLTPRARVNMAMVSQRFYEVLSKWDDVKVVVLDGDSARLLGGKFIARIDKLEQEQEESNLLQQLLVQCPSVNRIVAQCLLYKDDVKAISKTAPLLRQLSMSNANYRVTSDGCRYPDFQCDFTQLRTLNILPRIESPFRMSTQLTLEGVKKLFVPTLQKLRLVGIALRTEVFEEIFTLNELRVLDLGGCVVDSLAAQKVCDFDRLDQLIELSLPASLFTIHQPASDSSIQVPFSLRGLHNLKALTMHCEMLHEGLFMKCLKKFFPPNLKVLRLTGHTIYEPNSREWTELKLPFEIIRIRSEAAVMKKFKRIPDAGKLMSEAFWCHPYRGDPRPVNHPALARQTVPPVTAESWQLALTEVTAPLNKTLVPAKRFKFKSKKASSPAVHTARAHTPPATTIAFVEQLFQPEGAIQNPQPVDPPAPDQINLVDHLLLTLLGVNVPNAQPEQPTDGQANPVTPAPTVLPTTNAMPPLSPVHTAITQRSSSNSSAVLSTTNTSYPSSTTSSSSTSGSASSSSDSSSTSSRTSSTTSSTTTTSSATTMPTSTTTSRSSSSSSSSSTGTSSTRTGRSSNTRSSNHSTHRLLPRN